MILDNTTQREILLSLIASASFPGKVIDEIFALKKAVEAASIGATNPAKDAAVLHNMMNEP